ncbi:MAG TPA: hypothetical protein PKV66_05000, partial [Candidatus Pelethenecus sp.]|nr:hypothetical protein [Candidatus Pelethenecus sp.]
QASDGKENIFWRCKTMADNMPKWKENKLNYINDYEKENVKKITVRFNRNLEKDLIDFLETKDNKQGYIKQLIRDDMAKKQ